MRSIRTLGLLVGVALAVAATGPGVAQAWQIEGEPFSETASFSSSGGPIELVVPSLSLSVTCEEVEGSGEISGGSGGEGTVALSECEASAPSCTVQEPVELEAQFELTEIEEVPYVIFTPSASSFGTLVLSGCLFAGEHEIDGETCAEVGPSAAELEFRFSESIASSCAVGGLEISGLEAFIDGIAWQALTGEFEDDLWGAEAAAAKPAIALLIDGTDFNAKETKEAGVYDLDGKLNWTLIKVEATGVFKLPDGGKNCKNKAVNMKQGTVCEEKVTCDMAGKGKFVVELESGAVKYEVSWNLRCT